jgi:hypothetical protein
MDAYGAMLENLRQIVLMQAAYATPADTTKLCITCKWCQFPPTAAGPYAFNYCTNRSSLDLDRGGPIAAVVARFNDHLCGPDASWWAQRT